MSNAEFAKRLGVSASMVTMLANGERKFSYIRARNAAFILDCLMEELYEVELVKNSDGGEL
jgi:transcriptional regulator with XRE-family HTH domain